MNQPGTREYFERRAGEEYAAADRAGDSRAAEAHRALARRYDQLAIGAGVAANDAERGPSGLLASEFTILP